MGGGEVPTPAETQKPEKPSAAKAEKAAPAKPDSLNSLNRLNSELAALASKLGKKIGSIRSAWQWMVDEIGFRRATAALWPIAASGVLPPKAQLALLPSLARHAERATPEQLIAVLTHLPKSFAAPAVACFLEGYPVTVDALVTHAAFRAPEALAAAEGRLPDAVRRALPFVRGRLGQPTAAPGPELLTEFIDWHLTATSAADTFAWVPKNGGLAIEFYDGRFEVAATLASALGEREAFVTGVRARAYDGQERKHSGAWRVEPYWLAAPGEELARLLSETRGEREFQFRVLLARQDPPEALLAALKAIEDDPREVVGEQVAALIALGLGATPPPKHLDALLTFQFNPAPGTPGYANYLAGLRAFGETRILARVDAVLKQEGNENGLHALAGLAAFWDEKRFKAVAGNPDIVKSRGQRLGQAGPGAIPTLLAMLEALAGNDDRDDARRREELRGAVSLAARSAETLDPTWDAALGHCYDWRAVLQRLPQARRDAVLLAEQERDVTRLAYFGLASDAALDKAISRLSAKRASIDENDFALQSAFETLGARATAPLLKHFAGKTDAGARNVLDVTMLDDASYASLSGATVALPIVTGSVKSGAKYLALVAPHLAAAEPVGRLAIASGKIAFAAEGAFGAVRVLDREVPAGTHAVTARYCEEDLGAQPTAGLEGMMVRFRDAAPTSWEEARTGKKPVMGKEDLTSFALADAARAKAAGDDLAKAFEEGIGDYAASGDALGFTDDDRLLLAYVGEVSTERKLYWGLGADGTPVCLVAAFLHMGMGEGG